MAKITVREVLSDAERHGKTTKTQIRYLEDRLAKSRAATRIAALESFSIQFGGNAASTTSFNTEDPRFDDSAEPWDEVGFVGRVNAHRTEPRTIQEYTYARDIGRAMDRTALYAIGARKTRQDYVVGTGAVISLVAEDQESENEALTRRANKLLKDFCTANKFFFRQLDTVHRADRDGEAFVRSFIQADGPLKVRWVEPNHVGPPAAAETAPFGIECDPNDAETVRAYWIKQRADSSLPRRIPAIQPKTRGGPLEFAQIFHLKANVDQSWPRGWPLLWAARGALLRVESVKRNISVTVAIQTAISLIRKHDASAAEVQAFLDDTDDLKSTNNLTGKTTNYQGVQAGTVIDAGPGVTYEAPISSINAAQNIPAVDLELCSIAASLNMPAFMVSGKVDSAFAASLIGETPSIKHFLREQAFFAEFFREILWASVKHDVLQGRLPRTVLDDYRLEVKLPDPQIRQPLIMAQTQQIHQTMGVVSRRTLAEINGYDWDVERRLIEQETPAPEAEKPPAGQGKDGPGGADMKGNEDPSTSPSNVAFSTEEALIPVAMAPKPTVPIEFNKHNVPDLRPLEALQRQLDAAQAVVDAIKAKIRALLGEDQPDLPNAPKKRPSTAEINYGETIGGTQWAAEGKLEELRNDLREFKLDMREREIENKQPANPISLNFPEAAFNLPEQPAPIVNVEVPAPIVNVEAPSVNVDVEAPSVNVEAPVVQIPEGAIKLDVTVTPETKPSRAKFTRDAEGNITDIQIVPEGGEWTPESLLDTMEDVELLEQQVVGGAHNDAMSLMLRQLSRRGIKFSDEDRLKLQVVGTLQDESVPPSMRIQLVLRALLGEHAARSGGDMGGEVIPGTNT